MGDPVSDQDPSWVVVPPSGFTWTQTHLPTNQDSTSNIAVFFNTRGNRLKLFDATGEQKYGLHTWVSRYPILPMGVALQVVTKTMTPCELWLELHEFTVGRASEVAGALKHAMNYPHGVDPGQVANKKA